MNISDKLIRHWATICEGRLPMGSELQPEDNVGESADDDAQMRFNSEIANNVRNTNVFDKLYADLDDVDKRAFFMRISQALDKGKIDKCIERRKLHDADDVESQAVLNALMLLRTLCEKGEAVQNSTHPSTGENMRVVGGFEKAASSLVEALGEMMETTKYKNLRSLHMTFRSFLFDFVQCFDVEAFRRLTRDSEGTLRYFPETQELYKALENMISTNGSVQRAYDMRIASMPPKFPRAWPEEDPEVYEESAGGETGFQGMFRMMVAQQTDDRTVTGDSPEVKWWTDRAKAVVAAKRGGEAEFGRAAAALIQMVEAFGQDDYQDWPQTVVKTLLRELCGK